MKLYYSIFLSIAIAAAVYGKPTTQDDNTKPLAVKNYGAESKTANAVNGTNIQSTPCYTTTAELNNQTGIDNIDDIDPERHHKKHKHKKKHHHEDEDDKQYNEIDKKKEKEKKVDQNVVVTKQDIKVPNKYHNGTEEKIITKEVTTKVINKDKHKTKHGKGNDTNLDVDFDKHKTVTVVITKTTEEDIDEAIGMDEITEHIEKIVTKDIDKNKDFEKSNKDNKGDEDSTGVKKTKHVHVQKVLEKDIHKTKKNGKFEETETHSFNKTKNVDKSKHKEKIHKHGNTTTVDEEDTHSEKNSQKSKEISKSIININGILPDSLINTKPRCNSTQNSNEKDVRKTEHSLAEAKEGNKKVHTATTTLKQGDKKVSNHSETHEQSENLNKNQHNLEETLQQNASGTEKSKIEHSKQENSQNVEKSTKNKEIVLENGKKCVTDSNSELKSHHESAKEAASKDFEKTNADGSKIEEHLTQKEAKSSSETKTSSKKTKVIQGS